MSHARLQRLVRQSEEEGVTLGEMLLRTMTAGELDRMQEELSKELSRGYDQISDFMSEVEVPSLEEILEAQEAGEADLAQAVD